MHQRTTTAAASPRPARSAAKLNRDADTIERRTERLTRRVEQLARQRTTLSPGEYAKRRASILREAESIRQSLATFQAIVGRRPAPVVREASRP
jgi:hypothetical protein